MIKCKFVTQGQNQYVLIPKVNYFALSLTYMKHKTEEPMQTVLSLQNTKPISVSLSKCVSLLYHPLSTKRSSLTHGGTSGGKDYKEKVQKRRWGADSGGVFGRKGGSVWEGEKKKQTSLIWNLHSLPSALKKHKLSPLEKRRGEKNTNNPQTKHLLIRMRHWCKAI